MRKILHQALEWCDQGNCHVSLWSTLPQFLQVYLPSSAVWQWPLDDCLELHQFYQKACLMLVGGIKAWLHVGRWYEKLHQWLPQRDIQTLHFINNAESLDDLNWCALQFDSDTWQMWDVVVYREEGDHKSKVLKTRYKVLWPLLYTFPAHPVVASALHSLVWSWKPMTSRAFTIKTKQLSKNDCVRHALQPNSLDRCQSGVSPSPLGSLLWPRSHL